MDSRRMNKALLSAIAVIGMASISAEMKKKHDFSHPTNGNPSKCKWCGAELNLENFDKAINEICKLRPSDY
jgi:hypothetical protein